MKKLITICLFLLAGSFIAGMFGDLLAQKVAVVRVAMSPGKRSSGEPNFTAPAGPNYISTGLHVIGKGMKAYFSTIDSGVTTYSWTIASKPAGSAAVIDAPAKKDISFIADLGGEYIVKVDVNGGKSHADTIWVSTYKGTGLDMTCEFCHSRPEVKKFDAWKLTKHATIFKRGMTGNLEVDPATGRGAYAAACIKCHTTGWESVTNNGNFGYLAKTTLVNGTAWDTTWYKGLPFAAGDYWIKKDSTAVYDAIPAAMKPLGTIGCESCHGPAADHSMTAQIKKTDKSLDAGVCMQCHDAPKKHRLGSHWAASKHAILETGSETARTGCFPCHSGQAFIKFVENRKTPGWVDADGGVPISCAVCHEPHSDANPYQLRTVKFDSLLTGFTPGTAGGKGQLCMNCHRGRSNINTKITTSAPYYGFSDRFYNHYSPQADMFFGQNGYNYGQNLGGSSVHTMLVKDACVTCHMQTRTNGSSIHANHEMSMDSVGVDFAGVCNTAGCHSGLKSFEDKKAYGDYDGNGKIEGYVTEIQGLLAKLKSKLPLDASGEVVTMRVDSLKVKGKPAVIQGIWNYYFVKDDFSYGIHNPKYARELLQAAIAQLTGVQMTNNAVPAVYSLENNYPNPFNPATQIAFSIAKEGIVRILVYSITGELVKTIVDESMAAGSYKAVWNGTNIAGVSVASGVYLYRIESGSFCAAKKMLLVK